jgi:hypothetical protein
MVGLRVTTATIAVGLLLCASPALAQASQSANWAGYAVHASGQSFRQVVGVWKEPSATCRQGRQTFSSYWVGLGGFSARAQALEQTGTEVDCTAQGHVRAFAWYELVPAPAVKVHLKVPPGDLIRGVVTVTGQQVQLSLYDLTRHTQVSKTLNASVTDVSSAEWIVEAPSECVDVGGCVTLPLANFGSMAFKDADVQPTSGAQGSISDGRWRQTRIKLIPQDQSFVASHPGLGAGGQAAPSGLQGGGSAFTVSYSPVVQAASAARSSAAAARRSVAVARRLILTRRLLTRGT